MKSRSILLTAILVIALLVSGAVIYAQTPQATPPSTAQASSFTDGRINGDIDLGGLALYCTDQTGNTHVNTFQNGGIELWGVGGRKYIVLTAAQLRGTTEIMQPPATMEAGMTETPMPAATQMSGTQEAAQMPPTLLARAATPNGEVFFISLGNDNFELQGTDNTGKFFSYFWTGCSIGNIQAGAVPLFSSTPGASSSGASSTAMPTAEMTAASTTSP